MPAFASKHLRAYPLDPPRHLARRAAREGHQQNAARVRAIDDEMRDTMGERVGLARTRAGDDEKRPGRRACVVPHAVFDGPSLFGIELFEIGDGHGFRISMRMGGSINHVSCFAHNAFARGVRQPSSALVSPRHKDSN